MDLANLLRNRNFTKIWSAQILSQIAQNLLSFALVIRVFTLTSGTRYANVAVALMIISFGIPAVLFGSAAGVLVDYWDRKRVLVATNLVRAALVLLFPLAEHNLMAVYALSFVVATITQFFAPAEAASLPLLVKDRLLLLANSLFVFTMYGAWVVGYSASAPVIGLLGPLGPYLVTASMFIIAGLLVWLLPALGVKRLGERLRWSTVVQRTQSETVDNWRAIIANHRLYFPILQLTIAQAFISVLLVLAPSVSVALLHAPLKDTSQFLVIPAGLGLVAGVALVTRLARRVTKVVLINVSLTVGAGGLILLGLSGQLYHHFHGAPLASVRTVSLVVAALVFCLGLLNAMVAASAQTLLQENTTDTTRGRVFGALNVMVNVAAIGPVLIAGLFADLFSVTRVLMVLGGILLAYSIYQSFFMRSLEPLAEHRG